MQHFENISAQAVKQPSQSSASYRRVRRWTQNGVGGVNASTTVLKPRPKDC